MQPSEQMRLAVKAIDVLKLKSTPKLKSDICQVLADNGGDERKFMRAISKVKNVHESDKRPLTVILTACYEDEMSRYMSTDCDYCRGCGYVKLIQLCGYHNNKEKSWVFNFKKDKKQNEFLKANKTFTAQVMKYPCSCENGNQRNSKFDGDWIKPEIRRDLPGKAYIALFGSEVEMEDEENYINYQMMNRINGFKYGLDLPVYGVDRNKSIDSLKIEFRKSMESWV